MKAIIPVAGIGTKLRPHTHTQPKALVSVAGKPLIGHIVDFLRKGGVDEFIFVIGYMGEKIKNYLSKTYQKEISIEFVIQNPRIGSADAIALCTQFIKDEKEILIMLGDSIINLDIEAFINHPNSILGIQKVPKPSLLGIAEINKEGFVKKLIEKPKIPKSNLGLVGIYKIKHVNKLLDAIQHLKKNQITTNGEYSLTDALMEMVNQGEVMTTIEVNNWFDCGKKETLLKANQQLLRNLDPAPVDKSIYPNTVFIQPVKIGANCNIKNSIIGPNVVIGDDTNINDSIIKNSIIGSFSTLENMMLIDSLLGHDTLLKGAFKDLNVGDHTEISFKG